MPYPGPQPAHRKTFAVKHADGEPLTRLDLQYDLLDYIFSNSQAVFTDPYPTLSGDPPGTKVAFRDLYVNCLLHSPRCSKASRDKILESPEFGVEFAKMSLLSNVGRINTTMAFFPEMRTALRTYHPVPSLQKTDGNLQDAPRIKNILKSCALASETQGIIMTPQDVLARSRSGQVPPTSIVNLIFTFSLNAGTIGRSHFSRQRPYDFIDFFTPLHISSASRARAFLWLCYHYYEAPSPNPFADEHANAHPGQIPLLNMLSPEEAARENVDPPDEKEWGARMSRQRKEFLETKAREEEQDSLEGERERPKPRGAAARNRAKGKAKAVNLPEAPSVQTRDRALSPYFEGQIYLPQSRHDHPANSHFSGPSSEHTPNSYYDLSPAPSRYRSPTPMRQSSPRPERLPSIPEMLSDPARYAETYAPRPSSQYSFQPHDGKLPRAYSRKHRHSPSRYSPYPMASYDAPYIPSQYTVPAYTPPIYPTVPVNRGVPRRSMLEQAWHTSMNRDPLHSDDESADENTRLDYVLRLRIISRLRGKEPTPDPEDEPIPHHVHNAL